MDRNIYIAHHLLHEGQSLSARRAWIEMTTEIWDVIAVITVALRKESVDRNNGFYWWVEGDSVALRKESVDRNAVQARRDQPQPLGRSPQGERG